MNYWMILASACIGLLCSDPDRSPNGNVAKTLAGIGLLYAIGNMAGWQVT